MYPFSLNFRSNWPPFSLILNLFDPSFSQNLRSNWVQILFVCWTWVPKIWWSPPPRVWISLIWNMWYKHCISTNIITSSHHSLILFIILFTNVTIINFTYISYLDLYKPRQISNYKNKIIHWNSLWMVNTSSNGLQTVWEKDKHYKSYIQNSCHKIHGNVIYDNVIYIGRLNIFFYACYFIFIVRHINATSCQSTIYTCPLKVVVNVVM